MADKILVAYASKYGATREIAKRIGRVLSNAGLEVEVCDIEEVQTLDPFQGVVLGSAVYAGNWRKEAAEFLQENEKALAQRLVWLFSSGPTGEGDPVELMQGWRFPEALQPIAEKIEPRQIAFFHGELDMENLNLPEKLIVKAIKAPTGDYRDWTAIEAWAGEIVETIEKSKLS